jgi:hypothetical protein
LRRGSDRIVGELLATNTLDDSIDASPAIVGGEIFLRSKNHVYCSRVNESDGILSTKSARFQMVDSKDPAFLLNLFQEGYDRERHEKKHLPGL